MAPKKKKAPTAKDEVTDKEQLQKCQAELLALKRVLEQKTHEAAEARALERSWREQAAVAAAALEQAKADMADIKADMQRQHTALQDHAQQQVIALEGRLIELQQQLAAAQHKVEGAEAAGRQLQQDKEQQALSSQQEIERLHAQYAALLQDTLAQMRVKLQEQYSAACGDS